MTAVAIAPGDLSALAPGIAPVASAADSNGKQAPAEPRQFVNRDLSWLEFNRRVLHEAVDARTPLLERVRFLGIFMSNLDEFFMKRVGRLRTHANEGKTQLLDGTNPGKVITAVRHVVNDLLGQHARCFHDALRPGLADVGIHLLRWEQLNDGDKQQATAYFRENAFPILTPLAVDPGHPFPFISNLSESIGVILHHPDRGENLFARIKVPESLPRWLQLNANPAEPTQCRFISVFDLIRNHLTDLFPGMLVVDVMPFRVTRSSEPELEEDDEVEDLRQLVAEELRQRRFARVVRLEHGPQPNAWMVQILAEELGLKDEDIYEFPGGMEYLDVRAIAALNLPKHRYEPWTPTIPPALADEDADLFTLIRSGDLLVHHPYESFNASVERFVTTAAADPKVLAIKMTLYRTGEDSPFIRTLIQAAEARKQVVCLVELKARFDEERNILLARQLERAGVHVVYGLVGLKTHTKTILVVRQDTDRIRCYAHIGTGNYHAQTARLYTDLGLFTCDPAITGDMIEMFHALTGRSLKQDYRKLLVAPANMRPRFLEMIEREAEHARAGRAAQIVAKMNSLEDRKIIAALYDASQAGCEIDLIVRGFCCLRPGVPGLSERIRVTSVIGRFLEHSRVFYFRNGAEDPVDGQFFIGSGDWMYRNLLARVEVTTPIEDRALRARCWEVLQIMLRDQRQAWEMQPDGSYVQRDCKSDEPAVGTGTQEQLMRLTRQRNAHHTS
jgi:polyphosphate kinase